MTASQLAIAPQEIVITQDQIELVRRTVAKDATPDELELYFYDCRRQGVHPLDKLVYFTKRKGKYTPITSIDFMRIRAAESGEYGGNDDPVFDHDPGNDAGYPKSAFVSVYRIVQGQRCAFTATARWSEYAPDTRQPEGFMWKKMPHLMLGKVAEALALRKAFPKQLAGLYAKEEMDQAGQPEQKRQKITGKLTECKAFDNCSIAKIGKAKVVVMDGAHDSLFAQLGEREEKSELEVEVEQKAGPKGKYLELIQILTINGKPYLEGALEESVKAVQKKKDILEGTEITEADVEEYIPDLPAKEIKSGECISPVIDFGKKK